MKTMVINGRCFEVTTPRKQDEKAVMYWCNSHNNDGVGRKDIFDIYNRPSQSKIDIWRDWLRWALFTDGVGSFNVLNGNTFSFTITGTYHDENGFMYYLNITKDHNRLIEVKPR